MSKWGSSAIRVLGASDVSTLLSKETEIHGTVKTQGAIRVDGVVIGDLVSSKTVTIGTTGFVEGNINAEEIIVTGKVKGMLIARGRIALESTACLEGDLSATRLSIAEGASFRGLSNMGVPAAVPSRGAEVETTDAREPELDRIAAA